MHVHAGEKATRDTHGGSRLQRHKQPCTAAGRVRAAHPCHTWTRRSSYTQHTERRAHFVTTPMHPPTPARPSGNACRRQRTSSWQHLRHRSEHPVRPPPPPRLPLHSQDGPHASCRHKHRQQAVSALQARDSGPAGGAALPCRARRRGAIERHTARGQHSRTMLMMPGANDSLDRACAMPAWMLVRQCLLACSSCLLGWCSVRLGVGASALLLLPPARRVRVPWAAHHRHAPR